jgi:hypothetical protein
VPKKHLGGIMELFEMLVLALRDLAERSEQPGDAQQNAETLIRVARSLGLEVLALCCEQKRDALADCAARLRELALEHDLPGPLDVADCAAGEGTVTWRELQLAQAAQEQACRPGSQDLTPQEQMRRSVARLASVAGRIADSVFTFNMDEIWKPQADLLLLAVAFATAAGREMPDTPTPQSGEEFDAALRDGASPDFLG